ncbi:hypothetical protein WICMUC_004230 [Wickerhamomyces mucosus]|uniref:Crossover junction endonuclease MUS81 n=1 Tax=Wickerhamomyces mucosus TaxID=1378264 RepID=A0A9P8TB83_9ASCO|nr:hypothetical protein WICMUC_004230 [Wickerhamomyces mucosus]
MELPNDIKLLYITWLEELEEAVDRRQEKTRMVYRKALANIRTYENALLNPLELKKVPFIGDSLLGKLSKKLENYCMENGYIMPDASLPAQRKRKDNPGTIDDTGKATSKAVNPVKRKKSYIPAKNTGNYAILLVLLELDREQAGITKEQIISKANPYCTSSFSATATGARTAYSAWSGMKKLKSELLVEEKGRPAQYRLTDAGIELAEKLKVVNNIEFRTETKSPLQTNFSSLGTPQISSNNKTLKYKDVSYEFWEPGSYEIAFITDTREMKTQDERDFFQKKLNEFSVKTYTSDLPVGDGLWIGCHKTTGERIVLDYLFERKRLDDLVHSIKDGRYHEQKVRLKRTGIKNIFYIIEEYPIIDMDRMILAIETAMSSLMTVSNFHVKKTSNADDTVQFVRRATDAIKSYYENKRLLIIKPSQLKYQSDYENTLEQFRAQFCNEEIVHKYETFTIMLSKSKLVTVKEAFIQMLMCVNGISLEKALLIQRHFKTPKLLVENFADADLDLLSEIPKPKLNVIRDLVTKELYEN